MPDQGPAYCDDLRALVRRLGKPPVEWQRRDLVELCISDGFRVLNLHFLALDGKLKELRVPINARAGLDRVLAAGERVSGSTFLPGLLSAGASDLYVVPVYRWAFLNPWAADEMDIVCRFADRTGAPCQLTPDNVLAAVTTRMRRNSGLALHGLAELEFYLITERMDERFRGLPQRNYHQGAPYLHCRAILDEILRVVSSVTGSVKYCHGETGYIDRLESEDPELDGRRAEQCEVEFELLPIEDLACWMAVARWLIRTIADRHNASATFAPKLDEGMAGSGMHLHLALFRDGRNVMLDAEREGGLSAEAENLIGGLLTHASELCAFGNAVAASYLRLVPNQSAPTSVCWGRQNRSSLVRVPLGFDIAGRVDQVFNPEERGDLPGDLSRQTVEFRGPDGCAFPHLLLAALAACVEDGLLGETSLGTVKGLHVEGDVSGQAELLSKLPKLPNSAAEAARALAEHRAFFEERAFPASLLDLVIAKLREEDDEGLAQKLRTMPADERLRHMRRLMHKDLHKQ